MDHYRLPEGWSAQLQKYTEGDVLKPGEERPFGVSITMPEAAGRVLEPPLDGDVWGTMQGDVAVDEGRVVYVHSPEGDLLYRWETESG